MMPYRIHARALLCALAAATPATGQAPVTAQPSTQWMVDWQSPYCTISTGDAKDIGLSIWSVPGNHSAAIYIIGSRKRVPKITKGVRATIKLANGEMISAPAHYTSRARDGVLKLTVFEDHILEKLASASEISIQDSRNQLSVPIRSARAAMRAMRECSNDKLPDWGIDPARFNALKQLPKPAKPAPVHMQPPAEMPSGANVVGRGGIAVVRLTVDASGILTDCSLVESSGSKEVDEHVCVSTKTHKFTPAIGADGQPTAASYIHHAAFLEYRGSTVR
jgi:TonB family protein